MGGKAALKGFLLQTIISLLDALESKNEWTLLSLEPDIESEKVDIKWY